jgi:hypothetical protein
MVAPTVNAYDVPLVRPVTVQLSALVVAQVSPPGKEVTVYPEMTSPPVFDGASQVTVA